MYMKKSKQHSLFPSKESNKAHPPYAEQLTKNISVAEAISGVQKYIRRGSTEKALLLSFMLLERFPHWLFRRLIILSSEDIGNTNPMAAVLASSIYSSWLNCKKQSSDFQGRVLLAQLVIYLARSPKSREADSACILFGNKLVNGEGEKLMLDDYIYDTHTKRGRSQGRGMKHFIEEGAKLVNEQGKDAYRTEMIKYLKLIGKYK
jgi:replication-associated recombination protein RarA